MFPPDNNRTPGVRSMICHNAELKRSSNLALPTVILGVSY